MVSVQEVATIVLAGATIVLAWTSWNLFRATRVLAQIQERRERARALDRRWKRISRKLELARELIGTHWDDIAAPLSAGSVPRPEADYLRELVELVDEGDQVMGRDLRPLLQAFDSANRGTVPPEEPLADLEKRFERTKKRLGWDLQRWQNELVELSHEE